MFCLFLNDRKSSNELWSVKSFDTINFLFNSLQALRILAVVFMVMLAAGGRFGLSTGGEALHEIETPLDEMSGLSFHSERDGLTVVWVQSNVD